VVRDPYCPETSHLIFLTLTSSCTLLSLFPSHVGGGKIHLYSSCMARPHLTFLVSTSSCRMHCSKVHKVHVDSYHLCALLASALQGTPPVLLRTPPPNLFTLCGTTTGFKPPHCCWWRENLFHEAGGALRCLSSREMRSTSTSSHM